MERFKAGRIAKIKVKGFMTYDDLEIFPNKGLNFIIGLNGSGKSSIMSAICLGLAGKPLNTGKSVKISEFIKDTHTKATIEIELEESYGRNVLITRTIQEEKSTYMLNGAISSQADVIAVVKKYNIDVGNLCQFLPQEKVSEFSKMDRKERLENMLQAIGEPQMFTTFHQLKQMRQECNHREKQLFSLNNDIASEEQINSRLKIEVEKHEERKRLVGELENMKLRKTMIVYDAAKRTLTQLKVQKQDLVTQKQEVQRGLDALEMDISRVSSQRDEYISKMRMMQTKAKALSEKISKNSSDLSDLHENVQLAKIDFRNMITEKQNQKAKLAELLKQITGLQKQQEQLKDVKENISALTRENFKQFEEIKKELSALDHESIQITVEMNRYDPIIKNLQAKSEKMKNEQDKKMQFLKQRYRPTYDAICWLQQNKGSFKSTICEPAILSIRVDDDNSSKFIENTVGLRDLLAFVCQNKEDCKRLTSILREGMKLPINVSHIADTSISNYNSPQITTQMQQLGVRCYLKDLFTAPDLVMCYLCQIYKIHLIPICHNHAERNVNMILQKCRVFFTETERYAGTRSRYGAKNLSVKRDQFRGKGILLSSKDQSEQLQQVETELRNAQIMHTRLKENFQEFKNKRSALERKQEQNRAEKAEILDKSKRIQTIDIQLRQKTESYNRKQAEVIDERKEKAKETERIFNLNNQKMSILEDICSLLKEYHSLKFQKAKLIPLSKVLCQKVKDLTDQLREKRTQFEDVEKKYQEICQEFRRVKEKALEYLEELKKENKDVLTTQSLESLESNIQGYNIPQMSQHVLSLEDVEQKIINIQAQLDLNCEENHAAVQEYEERQRAIMDVQRSIKEMKEVISKLKTDITAKKLPWLRRLEMHIQNINAKFTQYYKKLNCAGEISLYQSEDTDDFLEYGLQIRLKYRVEEDFVELSQTRHSGGECSVAAIIFILSLQELTNVPFRCIDEINQGMDTVNERKIYQLIAQASSSGSSCSQYFLLTPKLLMDLSYKDNENVKVHIIFNSFYLNMKYNLKKHLRSAAAAGN